MTAVDEVIISGNRDFPQLRRRRRSSTIGEAGVGGDDSAESGLQLSSLIPFSQGATSTSSTCSAVSSSVRLCDDTFSYTNSSIGTGDSIAAEVLCFSPEPTDVEEEAEDVQTRPRKVSREKRATREYAATMRRCGSLRYDVHFNIYQVDFIESP